MSGVVYPPESVYNLIPKEVIHIQPPPRHISKYRPTVILERKLTKDAKRTMGPAKVEAPCPERYLKKHSKEPNLAKETVCSKDVDQIPTVKKPSISSKTDQPLMGFHTKRDFLKTPVTTMPMKPEPTRVDTRNGDKQPLENSGLVPKYIKKKQYGEVPEYLQQRTTNERRAKEEYLNFMKEQRERKAMKHLSDQERRDTLEGLKRSWDKLHHEYQSLSFVTDNLSKKAHKDQLEDELRQMEADINRFERFRTIYIPKDN
ncbi:enkurin [Clinocottus analis]|uniref:enkurin n=1 Tax=Clinocottus analis TaxID=304258 RepID=UPI0035C1DF0B